MLAKIAKITKMTKIRPATNYNRNFTKIAKFTEIAFKTTEIAIKSLRLLGLLRSLTLLRSLQLLRSLRLLRSEMNIELYCI